jgi:long-subunit fatty acid transport protein
VADTNPETCVNQSPEDMLVRAFIGEVAFGASIRATDRFWLGVTLRLPFSTQVADLWSNSGAAFGMSRYERVETKVGGVGFPSPRFGVTWKPHPKLTLAAMYRMYSRIKLTGTTKSAFLTGLTGDDEQTTLSEWNIPHMFQVGVASQINERLLVVLEYRMQFHAASKTGNLNQPSTVQSDDGALELTTVAPFGWRNVWSVRPGVEYRFRNSFLAWRGGINVTLNATNPRWANFRSAPWGVGLSGMTGLGFYWDGDRAKDQFQLDLGVVLSARRAQNGNEFIGQQATIPGTDDTVIVCDRAQTIQTGCPGRWGTTSILGSAGFTLQY